MNFFVGNEVPFQYIKYDVKKDIPMSGELRNDFSNYYRQIRELATDIDTDKLISDLSEQYSVLRSKLITEIQLSGDKKTTHTDEEMDFIFWCSYLLIDKFDFSQNDLSKIFGIKANKFRDFDLYPTRCHSAFAKDDYISYIPDATDTFGIKVAEEINKRIQAVYACSAFVGVSTDLDLLVNISSTDTKAYILTYPVKFDNQLEKLLCYPRFLFASANNFENNLHKYATTEIKNIAVNLVRREDAREAVKNSRKLRALLADKGNEYQRYLKTSNTTMFNRKLEKYRGQLRILNEIEDGSYSADDYVYDDEYRKMIGLGSNDIDLYDEQAVEEFLFSESESLCSELLGSMMYHKGYDDEMYSDYINALLGILMEKYKLYMDYPSYQKEPMSEDEKKKIAAIFWVVEAFGNKGIGQNQYDEILTWIESGKLWKYIDLVGKEIYPEISRGNGRKSKRKDLSTHLYYEPDDFDVEPLIEKSGGLSDKKSRPVLLYIDTDIYDLSMETVELLLGKYNILLVVHDTRGVVTDTDMLILSAELNLYYKENCYAGI